MDDWTRWQLSENWIDIRTLFFILIALICRFSDVHTISNYGESTFDNAEIWLSIRMILVQFHAVHNEGDRQQQAIF